MGKLGKVVTWLRHPHGPGYVVRAPRQEGVGTYIQYDEFSSGTTDRTRGNVGARPALAQNIAGHFNDERSQHIHQSRTQRVENRAMGLDTVDIMQGTLKTARGEDYYLLGYILPLLPDQQRYQVSMTRAHANECLRQLGIRHFEPSELWVKRAHIPVTDALNIRSHAADHSIMTIPRDFDIRVKALAIGGQRPHECCVGEYVINKFYPY